jgi:S-methylmethionine-dependent homocysteine/selenocysteine methylase
MSSYRNQLPQLSADLVLTDGGLETTLVFDDGIDLPDFAAFPLLETPEGRAALVRYYEAYLEVADRHGVGIALDTPTWRASTDWATKLGYPVERMVQLHQVAVDMLLELRGRWERPGVPVVLTGVIGPRGDGYRPGELMSPDEAEAYHRFQAETFAGSAVDLVAAVTMNYEAEAVGIARAAEAAGVPVAISFTVETDGALPTGQSLGEAIQAVDEATGGYPAYYMVNCAHPTHFAHVLDPEAPWSTRIAGIRANSSRMSHAELDEAEELDAGDPAELGQLYRELRAAHPSIRLVGGCCGTTHVHVDAISDACLRPAGS